MSILALMAYLGLKSWSKPGYALALIWGMYAAEQVIQFGLPVFAARSSLLNIALALIAVTVAVKCVLQGRIAIDKPPTELLLLLALLSMCVASTMWSVSPKITNEKLLTMGPYILAYGLIAPFCCYNHRELANAVSATIWLGGAVIIGHALCPIGYRGLEIKVGIHSAEANPLAAANYAAYVGTFILFDMLRDRKGVFLNVVRLSIAFLSIWIIVRSGSRGQLIAFVVANFIWLPIGGKLALRRSAIVGLACGVIATAIAIWMVGNLANAERWDWDKAVDATTGRQSNVEHLLSYWVRSDPVHWIVGLGSSSSIKIFGNYPHNVPVEVLCEEGLIGFALFAAFIYTGFTSVYRGMGSKYLTSEQRMSMAGLAAVTTVSLILMNKSGNLLGISELMSFIIVLGLTSQHLPKHKVALLAAASVPEIRRAR